MIDLVYIFESSLILGIGFLYYHFLLRKEARFQWHRIYLIALVLAGLGLPLLEIPYSAALPGEEVLQTTNVMLTEQMISPITQKSIDWTGVLVGIYWLGVMGMLASFVWKLSTLIRLIRRYEKTSQGKARIVHTPASIPISTFFHYIFWHEVEHLESRQRQQIMDHELCHVRQGHSMDSMLLEILLIFFWFQPFLYLLRKVIHQNHEYIADRASLQHSTVRSYTQLILTQLFGQQLSFVHSFFHPPLTMRVRMLQKQNSPLSYWKYMMLLPLFAALFMTVSCAPDAQDMKAENIAQAKAPVAELVQEVDQAPKPLNMAEVQMKVGFPKAAYEQGLQGRVLIKVLVDKDGKYLRHEIAESPDDIFTDAVEQHIKELTFEPAVKDDKPVQFWVTIPFTFKLK